MRRFCRKKYLGSYKQRAGKIGGKLEKWAPRNGSLTLFFEKDRDTLIEQSLCTEYSNRTVTHACKRERLHAINFADAQQNRKISSKILSKIRKK